MIGLFADVLVVIRANTVVWVSRVFRSVIPAPDQVHDKLRPGTSIF
jgi:hypothetical protein